MKQGVPAVFAALLLAGCASGLGRSTPMAKYQPDVDDRQVWPDERKIDERPGRDDGAASPWGSSSSTSGGSITDMTSRQLQAGNRIGISLLGIPEERDLKDVIDDRGTVTLPNIGRIKIAGMTTSEAEEVIENAYVRGGVYRQIEVIVVTQEEEYFVQGEVKREGKYPLMGDATLLQVLATAGGYTEFADPRKVQVIRKDGVTIYDAKAIEARRAEDPLIQHGDVVKVPRRWM